MAAITFDATQKGPDLVLSEDALTLTHGASSADWEHCLVTGDGKSSGKWYFEVQVVSALAYAHIGVGQGTESLESYIGDTSAGWCYMRLGRVYNSSYTGYQIAWVDGDILQVALDMDNGKIWFGNDNVWSGVSGTSPDPETGTDPNYSNLSGTVYAGAGLYSLTDELTIRLTAADFSYPIPDGFAAYDPTGGEPEAAYTWDPLKCNANITLSEDNRLATATVSTADQSVISTVSKSSGKWYWELEVPNPSNNYCAYGICDQDEGTDFDSSIRATDNEAWSAFRYVSSVRLYHDGSFGYTNPGMSWYVDVLMFALDLDNGRLYFGSDGTWCNQCTDPATDPEDFVFEDSTIDEVIAACFSPRYADDWARSCFKASELNYTPPTGYYALDNTSAPTQYEPEISAVGFGLAETLSRDMTWNDLAAVSGLGLSVGGLGHNFGAVLSGLGLADVQGRIRTMNKGAVAKIDFTGAGGASNATLHSKFTGSGFGLTGEAGFTMSISPPAKGRIRFNEETGAAFAVVLAGGDADSHGVGITEEVGAAIADSTTAEVFSGIGFDETAARINDEFFAGVDVGIGFGDEPGRHIETTGGVDVGLGFALSAIAAEWTKNPPNVVAALSFGDTAGALNYSAFVRENQGRLVYTYYGKITGGADGLADYEFPSLKSFQTRMRSGDPSYLSLVLPFNADVLTAINVRTSGEIVVEMAAGLFGETPLREELIRTGFDSIRYDRGADSQSITLTGFKTIDFGTGATTLSNVMTKTQDTDGTLRFRCSVLDFFLRPGHVASYGDESFTVDAVSCIVGPTSQYMDVAE